MSDYFNKNYLGLFSAIYLIIALSFIIWPGLLKRMNEHAKKWYSLRKITKSLDIMRDVDEQIFKVSKTIGIISLLLALTFIYLYFRY